VVEQRSAVVRALCLAPGQQVLDIGSGPGLLLRELALSVGPEGAAVGLDLAAPMLEAARRRCAGLAQVALEQGDAAALPFADARFDALVTTQVYEYVRDIPAALAEARRVLRPGGRLVVLDTDYDSLVVHTADPARLARILEAWDEHFVHRGLPRTLGAELRAAGFRLRERSAIPIFDPEHQPNAFSWHLTKMIARFSAGRARCTEADAQGWLAELAQLGREGRYFFSLNRYLFVADKPG
jgi:SAM-dependent methyltransferase